MCAPLLLWSRSPGQTYRSRPEPDGAERLPAAGNQGGFCLPDERTARQRRGGLGLPHIHANPAADHGDIYMTASGTTRRLPNRNNRAWHRSCSPGPRSLGGPVADANSPAIVRPDRDVDSHQHLVHVNIRLELIDGDFRYPFPWPGSEQRTSNSRDRKNQESEMRAGVASPSARADQHTRINQRSRITAIWPRSCSSQVGS